MHDPNVNPSQNQYGVQSHYSGVYPKSRPDGSFIINGNIFFTPRRCILSKAIELWNKLKTLQYYKEKLKKCRLDAEDLRSRLSGFASKQLTSCNPDFTDLSDKNRPIKLAEKFRMIHDEEWANALKALTNTKKGTEPNTEEQAIRLLMEVIKICDRFCKNYAAKQLNMFMNCFINPFDTVTCAAASTYKTSNVLESWLTEFKTRIKTQHSDCVTNAVKAFVNGPLMKIPYGTQPEVQAYATKCIEDMWLMAIQEPPMDIAWPVEHKPFNSAHYMEYWKKGTVVKLPVWPAVFLHKDGPLMSKGYVMPM